MKVSPYFPNFSIHLSAMACQISKKGILAGAGTAALIGFGCWLYQCSAKQIRRKIIVLTDLEPDDRMALDVLASYFKAHNILFVGSTVMQAARKAALIRKHLNQLGLVNVPVYQGTGGTADSYSAVNSTKAAKTYLREGQGVLTDRELEELRERPHSSDELQKQIKKALEVAVDKSIEVAMLAPPTDLVKVLVEFPNLQNKIKHIHIMGGWSESLQTNRDVTCRTTYNWDMDPLASAQLMEMSSIPMTLYSSHLLKRSFPGGSINIDKFPRLMQKMEEYKVHLPSLEDSAKAKKSWNQHVMDTIPSLKPVISPYADHQLTPADPAVIVGMINAGFVVRERRVRVRIDLMDQTECGHLVHVEDDPTSQILLVEEIDLQVFEQEMLATYERLLKNRLSQEHL